MTADRVTVLCCDPPSVPCGLTFLLLDQEWRASLGADPTLEPIWGTASGTQMDWERLLYMTM